MLVPSNGERSIYFCERPLTDLVSMLGLKVPEENVRAYDAAGPKAYLLMLMS